MIEYSVNVTSLVQKYLQKWITEFNPTQASVNSLLRLQSQFFPLLPTDSRAVVKSIRKVQMLTVPPGRYSHIGLKNNIDSVLLRTKDIPSEVILDLHVDGFPLHKNSSENSGWEVSARCYNLDKKVFLIGAYSGPNQPADFALLIRPFVDEIKDLMVNYIFQSKRILIK